MSGYCSIEPPQDATTLHACGGARTHNGEQATGIMFWNLEDGGLWCSTCIVIRDGKEVLTLATTHDPGGNACPIADTGFRN